ncbi:MAG: hypothetical protein K0R58_27 [Ramlibacter sp.]|jgi:hypothetical protein|nr:hypothetical protein [Ramlibacter sp.]
MKLYDIEEEHRRQRRERAIEAVAALCGLAGALLLALRGEHAGWGWAAFLASNAGWIVYALVRSMPWMLLQQIGFTATSVIGIWQWLVLA